MRLVIDFNVCICSGSLFEKLIPSFDCFFGHKTWWWWARRRSASKTVVGYARKRWRLRNVLGTRHCWWCRLKQSRVSIISRSMGRAFFWECIIIIIAMSRYWISIDFWRSHRNQTFLNLLPETKNARSNRCQESYLSKPNRTTKLETLT